MNTSASQSPLVAALDSNDSKDLQGEAPGELNDVLVDTRIERDCLCGTFTVRGGPFAMPMNTIKSRW
jgi:hypothetical protein